VKYFLSINKFQLEADRALGWHFFQIGVFLLPSTVFLSGCFLFIAGVLATFKRSDSYWKDPWNYPLILIALWMIIGCFRAYSGWLAWVGLANWLPFFWCFWAFQPYLLTSQNRKRVALCLISGTVPVVATGLGQIFFGWHGPWQLFNGLIIWFIDPGGEPIGRLSGLFDYANIAGAWLALVWPFALAALIQPSLSFKDRSLVFILATLIVASLVLTDSRNAWGAFVLAFPFVLGPISWFWLMPLLLLSLLPLFLAVLPGINFEIQQFARILVPERLWSRLNDMKFTGLRSVESTRLHQWKEAINLVSERPFFGWGAAAFSVLYSLREGIWHGHSHNLPLELAVSSGVPVAVLLVAMVISLLVISLYRLDLWRVRKTIEYSNNSLFDRAWWTSMLILISLHGTDMPLFDSRINIAGWIILAGLRCLILFPHAIKNPLTITE
tara:strand:- start:6926 stop:8245 length:1320 start_codon:yes stop_codon:yes gene_type:complete